MPGICLAEGLVGAVIADAKNAIGTSSWCVRSIMSSTGPSELVGDGGAFCRAGGGIGGGFGCAGGGGGGVSCVGLVDAFPFLTLCSALSLLVFWFLAFPFPTFILTVLPVVFFSSCCGRGAMQTADRTLGWFGLSAVLLLAVLLRFRVPVAIGCGTVRLLSQGLDIVVLVGVYLVMSPILCWWSNL